MTRNAENDITTPKTDSLQLVMVSGLSALGLLVGTTGAQAEVTVSEAVEPLGGEDTDTFSLDASAAYPQETIALLPGDANFQPEMAFQLPSSAASGEVFPLVDTASWDALPTTVPDQVVALEHDFSAQPSQIAIPSVVAAGASNVLAPAPVAPAPIVVADASTFSASAPAFPAAPTLAVSETDISGAEGLNHDFSDGRDSELYDADLENVAGVSGVADVSDTDASALAPLPRVALPAIKNEGFLTLALEDSEAAKEETTTAETTATTFLLPRPDWNSPTGEILISLETENEGEEEEEEIDQAQRFVPAEVPLIALDVSVSEDDGEEETSWLALRNPDDTDQAVDLKLPWLALSTPSAAEPAPAILRRPTLALNPAASAPKKRTENWLSTALLEITDSELRDDEAETIASLPAVADAPAYDVDALSQVAITPIYLANDNEFEVSVGVSEVEFLSPESGAFLDIPSTSVVLRFPVGAKIALLANGQEVANDLVGRTSTDSGTGLRTQTWYGVTLVSGENVLEVVSTDTGEVLQSLPVVVRGEPEELVLLSPRAVPADGRSTSTIRGHLLDAEGNISLWNSVATVRASDGEFLGADYDPDVPGFQVPLQQGEFTAELRSSLESHLVQIQAQVSSFEAFSQVQFLTQQRPSLLSGVVDVRLGARGTDFYDSYRDFLPLDGDNRYELDVDAAVFATGNVGEWLYTGAYNSERSLNEDCTGEATLFGAGGSCEGYSLYGDDSSAERIAPSLDSVYLRFERNSPSNELRTDYAMWGDFNTEEFATAAQLFTSTSRQLHGLKAHYNFGDLAVTALYANNVEGFQRDTIAPDGTSGLYFTSERNIVPGSETVFFELEELERPGSVLDRQPLSRGTDYEIDYDRGTLLFNDAVARTSVDSFGQLLVRRIVTTYQHEDGSDTNILAGRLQYDLNDTQTQESWIGTSYFSETQGSRNFSLYGADARIALGDSAQLIAEVARSTNNTDAGTVGTGSSSVSGTAYRVELDGSVGGLAGRAHFRTTDAGFSNSATTSFVPGQTRYGAQLTGQIGESTSIRAQYDHEDNFGTAPQILTDVSQLLTGLRTTGTPLNNSLTTYSLGVSQRFGEVSAEVDWIHRDRQDRTNSLASVSSDQLRSRLTYPIANNLTLVAQNEINLSSAVDPIYPSRTLIGLNWQAMPWLNVGVNQIFYGGGGNNRGSSTSIDVSGEHTFSSDTTVRGRFSTIDGRNIGGSIGLEQGINLAPGLNLDLAYEKVFSTFGNQTAAGSQISQSVATGNTAAALGLSGGESYSIGLSYTDSADFQGSTRFEHRQSSGGTNTVFNASAVGRLSPSLSVLGDYRLNHAANRNVSGVGRSSQLKLGLAYRNPADDRFNALLRYEHRTNPNSLPTSASLGASTETEEHLFATEAIYAPNWQWEFYGKYALRNSRTSLSTTGGGQFSSSNTVQLAQARATYRMGFRWDAVAEARWIGGDGFSETGYSLEAGYYPLPDLRLSAGYSGGATDSDFGDNRSAGGFYVGVTAKLGGLFSGFGTQPIAPVQSQESIIEVSNDTSAAVPPEATGDLSPLQSEDSAAAQQTEASGAMTFDVSSPDEAPVADEAFPSAVEL